MSSSVLIVGHKNPDNDSISSAIGYAYLKNELARRDGADTVFQPCRLGPLPPETAWVCEEYGLDVPALIDHVHPRVSDVMSTDLVTICEDETLLSAGRLLRKHGIRALVVTDAEGKYKGLVSVRTIADRYIAATDAVDSSDDEDTARAAVAESLVASLSQKVSEALESDVLQLSADGLLSEAVEDLMASSLREGIILDGEGVCRGIVTRSDVATAPRRKVILVDHNETRQAVDGIEDAEVVEIVDHHRIGDVTTSNPIRFNNMPVGSSASIVTSEYRRLGVEIPKSVAAALLSAVLTDTVILKSPTATDFDRDQVQFLSDIIGIDAVEFGLRVFKCRGGEETMPIDRLVCADAKEFQTGDSTVFIAQRETVDLQTVLSREAEIREYMADLVKKKGYDFMLLMVTDILAEGSQFIVEGNTRLVERVFGITCQQGGNWMPGVLSRKKQVAAPILSA